MNNHKEVVVPIIITNVTLETHMGTIEKHNVHYHNVLVQGLNSVNYVQNTLRTNNYIRKAPIIRCHDEEVTWPDHPHNINGKIQGAIIIIESSDAKILLVRNRKLWGLPKGARSYDDFLHCKQITDDEYIKTGTVTVHENAVFSNDRVENAIDNIHRETLEETGIDMDKSKLEPLRDTYQTNTYCAYDGFFYSYPRTSTEYNEDLLKHGTDHENDELLWVPYDELRKLLHKHRSPSFNKVFNHITYWFLDSYMREC